MLVIGLATIIGITSWILRFTMDDAYISFDYARNLAEGNGLAWNTGIRTEGFSNLLWVLLMSISYPVDVDVVVWSQVFGISALAFTVVLSYITARLVLGTGVSVVIAALVGLNYSVIKFGTGGLETALHMALQLSVFYLALRLLTRDSPATWRIILLVSVLYYLAWLNRPDAFVLIAVTTAALAIHFLRTDSDRRQAAVHMAILLGPAVLFIAGTLLWKQSYFGELLPNTYYVKATGQSVIHIQGFKYLSVFLYSYLLFPIVGVALFLWVSRFKSLPAHTHYGLAILVVWALYVIRVQGDFFEFRFMVPVIPIAAVTLGYMLHRTIRRSDLKIALVGLILVGSLHHAVAFGTYFPSASVGALDTIERSTKRYEQLGESLASHFGEASEMKIAVTAAGAIPYISRLETVDMHGLNDPFLARHGRIRDNYQVGHARIAEVQYMIDEGVHLILGHPTRISDLSDLVEINDVDSINEDHLRYDGYDELPASTQLLAIPSGERYLIALYVTPNDEIDRLIANETILAQALVGRNSNQ